MNKTLLNLLLISISVALYYVAISPIYYGGGSLFEVDKGITQLQDLNGEYDGTIAQVEGLLAKVAKLKSDYDSITQEEKNDLNVMIPDKIDKVRLISETNSILTSSGISYKNLSSNEEGVNPKLPNLGVYSITFGFSGSYFDLKDILHTFETSKRLYSVQSVSLKAGEKTGDPMVFEVKMYTYYMKQ